MEKVQWSRKRLRHYLYLGKAPLRNDLIAFVTLSAFLELNASQDHSGDKALLKACFLIPEYFPDQYLVEKETALKLLSATSTSEDLMSF